MQSNHEQGDQAAATRQAAQDVAVSRDQIRQIGGHAQVGIIVAGDVHGDIYPPPASPSIVERLERARNSLAAQSYAAAQAECELVLQVEPTNAHARLFTALALLGGNYADRVVAPPTIRRIEADLLAATHDTLLAPTAWAILGIVKIDFDTNRNQHTFQHTLRYIKQALKGAGIEQIDQKLFELVRTTEQTRRDLLS